MKEKFQKLPLRNGVGIAVLNKENKIFVAKRIDNPADFRQMPQGGIDEGEDVRAACFREMEEEIGTNLAEWVDEHPDWLNYDIPEPLANRLWHGQFKGQAQKWVLLRYKGTDSDINIATQEPEFEKWQWMSIEQLIDLAVPFKKDVYRTVLGNFETKITS